MQHKELAMSRWLTILLVFVCHAHAAELPEKSIAGTYEILICKDSCPAAGDKDVLVKGRLVLFPENFQPSELTRLSSLRRKLSSTGYEAPNACFELEKLQGRDYKGYAGITKAGLTAWSSEGDELQFGLYRSADAIYRVTARRTTTGFDGKGESWGAGVAAAPDGATLDKVVLRRTGAADMGQCPQAD